MSPIAFNLMPASILVPNMYIEVDNTRAEQGPSIQPYKILAIGQRLSTGSKAEGELVQVVDNDQAKEYFGFGSQLARQVEKIRDVNKATELWCVALDDDGGAVDATGALLFTGPATDSGTIYLYIAGIRYTIAVASTDTAADIATAVVAEVGADVDSPVSVAVNGGTPEQVDITAKNGGESGNDIDLRFNYYDGEVFPDGVGCTITAMNGGTSNPDIATAIAALTEDQYNIITMPYTDAANLSTLDNELDDRHGPIRQNFGVAFLAKRDSYANLSTFGSGKNSKNYSVMGMDGPNCPLQWAGQVAGIVALAAQNDPARPFQTLSLSTILAPSEGERFSWTERNLLLEDGIATYNVITGGNVTIERLVTTYKQNSFGSDDTSFRDSNTLLTLEYLRYDLRRAWLNTYPRAKLANDGTNFGPGQDQVIVTPKTAKAFILNKFRDWESLGLVEGFDQFKRDLVVERSITDPNTLEILLPPDLVNQLRVTKVLLQFRL